jgi:hypothetical protein
MSKTQFCLGLTCLSFGIVACEGEPEQLEISSTQAALTASENAELALQGVIDASDFLASSTSIAKTLNAFGAGGQTCESSGSFCPVGAECPPVETVCTSHEISEEDLEEARQEIREGAQDLVRQLRERILIEANLESSTSTSATYRLGVDVLCSDDSDDAPTGAAGTPSDVESPDPEGDGDCAAEVTRLEPRVMLTSPREGDIDVTLQLGAERHSPLTLELYRESLGLRLDLGESVEVARDFGEDLQGLSELSGSLEWQLVRNAASDYSLEFNVLEPVSLVVESEGDTLTASLAANSPAWNVRIDGNTNTLSAGLDLGTLRVMGPLRLFADMFERDASVDSAGVPGEAFDAPLPQPEPEPEPEPRDYTGIIELLLSGLSGTVSYTADSDVLSFTDLGFGDDTSTLKHDGNTLLGLDLNALSGRRVNLEVSPTENGAEVRISPSFDLKLAFAFEHIADQFEGIADYLMNETLRFWFEGESPAIELHDEQLQVTSGTLHLDSQTDPSVAVTVAAGMCLGEAGDSADDSSADESSGEGDSAAGHPLASIAAVACE